jgi:hypothetical protein
LKLRGNTAVEEEEEVDVLHAVFLYPVPYLEEYIFEEEWLLEGLGVPVPHISIKRLANSVASSPPVPRGLSLFKSLAYSPERK